MRAPATTLALALAATLNLPARVLADLNEVWWNITYVENANPDGLFPRRVIGVNGTWPPPPIVATTNDTLVVHATNSLPVPTSLHHHGMFFNSSSWNDGAMWISQCGIPPGGTFDYVIPINSSQQHGTYWAHAHSDGQYVDGLRTPLAIHGSAAEEPYSSKYDDEYTVVLGDWYHQEHLPLLNWFLSVANPGGAEPVPDSALIYFSHGTETSYLPPISGTTVSGSSTTAGTGFNENATLPFQPGKTYRLRIVNTSAFAMFFFWIDGHDMRIIEVDGIDVEEYPTDIVTLTVAQRYSVLVTARNDSTPQNWAIHANMDTTMFDTVPPALNPNITSSVTYAAGANLTDNGFIDLYHDINDTALVPTDVIPQLPAPMKQIELEVTFDTLDNGGNRAMFNLVTWNFPVVPSVVSALTLGGNATAQGAYGPLTFILDHLEVFEIVLKNGDAGKHPFHLHGHKFQMVGRSTDYTSDDPTLNPPIVEGQLNPMRRDTVQVPSGSSVTLRVVADNPGVWIFHCHIEWHLSAGLAMQIIEAPLEMQARAALPGAGPPQTLFDQCAAQHVPTSGNAAGHNSTTDLSGLKLGPYPQVLGWRPKGIGAMFGCVFTAFLGMLTVTWYAFGGQALTEEEMEEEMRQKIADKERRGKLFGLIPGKRR